MQDWKCERDRQGARQRRGRGGGINEVSEERARQATYTRRARASGGRNGQTPGGGTLRRRMGGGQSLPSLVGPPDGRGG